jgi:hypothetical protein
MARLERLWGAPTARKMIRVRSAILGTQRNDVLVDLSNRQTTGVLRQLDSYGEVGGGGRGTARAELRVTPELAQAAA